MSYRLIIDPSARLDIIESIRWYNEQKPGLGSRYFSSVKHVMKLIKKSPGMFQIRYKSLRMVPIERFSFIILYQVDEAKKLVAVAAVLHTSRNPKIWEERTNR
jgi:plasmid stabilization system protein ParE